MEKNRHDDAGPAREELDDVSDAATDTSGEPVPDEELPADEAAAADSDRAPVPDPNASAPIPEDV